MCILYFKLTIILIFINSFCIFYPITHPFYLLFYLLTQKEICAIRCAYLFLHTFGSGIAPFAGNISHIDDLFSAAGVDLFVFLFHIVHTGACGIVEFLGVGIQHISNSLGFLWCRQFR